MADPSEQGAAPSHPVTDEFPSPVTLEDSAGLLGTYAWIEARTFELLGGWVAVVPELDVKARLAVHSHHHAWHASLWRDRLPHLRELDAEVLEGPANDEVVALFDALAEPAAPELTIEKLVGAYRVLVPRKISALTRHRKAASSVSDGPVIRALDLVLRDEIDDWREGEMLVQSLLGRPDEVQRASEHQARLERLVVAAGGIAGQG